MPTTSKCICGAFKVSTNTNNPLHFIHFLLPEVKIKDGNLHLEWTKLDPALTLDVHWSKHPNEDEFLDMISLQKLGWKGTWPAIVEIITRRPETPKMIGELVK